MILTGKKIQEEVQNKNILIEPFSTHHITTNSYDVSIGNKFISYKDKLLDVSNKPNIKSFYIKSGDLIIDEGEFLLGHTIEKIGSPWYVPILHARSGIARLGLFVHVTSDLIDLGSFGQLTLQLFATKKIRVRPGMKIGQVTFWKIHGNRMIYNGKYQNSCGPQASKIYRELNK